MRGAGAWLLLLLLGLGCQPAHAQWLERTVDVERRTIEVPTKGWVFEFRLDDDARRRLLAGLDDIGVTLQHPGRIDAFESRRPSFLPRMSPVGGAQGAT